MQEICTISVIPGIPLPPTSIKPPAFNRFLFSMMTLKNIAAYKYEKHQWTFFCRQTNTNLKPLLCCYMFKNCSKLSRIFFPHHNWCLFLGQEIKLTPKKFNSTKSCQCISQQEGDSTLLSIVQRIMKKLSLIL